MASRLAKIVARCSWFGIPILPKQSLTLYHFAIGCGRIDRNGPHKALQAVSDGSWLVKGLRLSETSTHSAGGPGEVAVRPGRSVFILWKPAGL